MRRLSTSPRVAAVLCAHGTANPAGQATVLDLCAGMRRARPGLPVMDAYVDVQQPRVAGVVDQLVSLGFRVVVVPLLLSGGYHVDVDVAAAVDPFERATSSGPLGPSHLLTRQLLRRIRQSGAGSEDAIVVAAAGSSRPQAAADLHEVASELSRQWRGPVSVGFGASATPSVAEAVALAREAGAPRVVIASYLLGYGHFHDVLGSAGADQVTEPLGPSGLVLERILEQFDLSVAAVRSAA